MSTDTISHTGIIRELFRDQKGTKALVEVVASGACVSCQVNGSCSTSAGGRVMETWLTSPAEVGDRVRVEMAQSLSWLALVYSFGIPLLLIFLSFFGLRTVIGENGAALGSLVSLVPYFALLWSLQKRMRKTFKLQSYKL